MIEQLCLSLIQLSVRDINRLRSLGILLLLAISDDVLILTLFAGNIINFNIGASVDLDVPRSFWSRLAGKYGNMFYWKEKVIIHSTTKFLNLVVFFFFKEKFSLHCWDRERIHQLKLLSRRYRIV